MRLCLFGLTHMPHSRITLWPLAVSPLHWRAGSVRSFAVIRKEAGPFCGSFQREGEVFAYVRSIQTLKDLKVFRNCCSTLSHARLRLPFRRSLLSSFFTGPKEPRDLVPQEGACGTKSCGGRLGKVEKSGQQQLAQDPVYGRAKCLPMLGEIKT